MRPPGRTPYTHTGSSPSDQSWTPAHPPARALSFTQFLTPALGPSRASAVLLEDARQVLPEPVLRAFSWETSLLSGEAGVRPKPGVSWPSSPSRPAGG